MAKYKGKYILGESMEIDWEKIAEALKSQPNVKNDSGLAYYVKKLEY